VRIKLRYFAYMRELIGFSEEEVQLPEETSVESLIEIVKRMHEPIRKLSRVLVAVNGDYVESGKSLEDGDIVAMFPPVSGG
jgi:molybdopterin synthase sulfur carrier subunit